MSTLIFLILFVYLTGALVSFDLMRLIEKTEETKFTKKEYLKLSACSWYSCIVLRNILIKND